MKRRDIGFKNKWKLFSHLERIKNRSIIDTLEKDDRLSYQNQRVTLILSKFQEFIESKRTTFDFITAELPRDAEKKTVQHWELAIGMRQLDNSELHLLSKEMHNFISDNNDSILFNKMIQIKWEMARLVEMVQVENFRYEFIRKTLFERGNPTKEITIARSNDNQRLSVIQNAQKNLNMKMEKKLEIRKKLDSAIDRAMRLVSKKSGNSEII